MNFLATVAIIAVASSGLAPQDQPQTTMQRFIAAQPQLESYLAALQYKEAIQLLDGMIPAAIPELEKSPEDPNVLLASLEEVSVVHSMYVYLGRAQVLSGEIEKAIDSFKKAQDLAEQKAAGTEDLINLRIQSLTQAVTQSEVRLKEIQDIMAQKQELEKEIEGKRKLKTSKEKIKRLDKINKDVPNMENQAKICNQTIERVPVAIEQLNASLAKEKQDAGRFAPVIAGLEESIKVEQELISAKYGGDTAKYVTSVVNTKQNLENQKTKLDKAGFLNRLLVLDPANKDVLQQIALLAVND